MGTVFKPLRNPGFLAQAAAVSGAVTWPNGADLLPDAMYDAIRAEGVSSGVSASGPNDRCGQRNPCDLERNLAPEDAWFVHFVHLMGYALDQLQCHPFQLAALDCRCCSLSCGHFKLPMAAATRVSATTPHARVRYLGTGGYLVEVNGTKVLFGPEYTNPSLVEVVFKHQIRSDVPLIEHLLPREADAATAILVGHSHHDHPMNGPYVAIGRAKGAIAYGSSTTRTLLAPLLPRLQAEGRDIVALDCPTVSVFELPFEGFGMIGGDADAIDACR